MFEKVAVRYLERAPETFDVGILAELLIFYKSVHLILSKGALGSLINTIGVDNFISILDRGFVKASFVIDDPATHTTSASGLEVHDFGLIKIVGHVDEGRIGKKKNIINVILRRSKDVRNIDKKIDKIISVMPIIHLGDGLPRGVSIEKEVRKYVLSKELSDLVIRRIIPEIVPGLEISNDWFFRVMEIDRGLFVDTNIPLEKIRRAHNADALTQAYILNSFYSARYDLWLSARYMSELVTSTVSSRILSSIFSEWVHARDRNAKEVELFQKIFLNESHAIAEAVNDGGRTIQDALVIAEKAARFKEWLTTVNPDEGVVAEYYKSISRGTWLERLPGKTLRFAFCAGAGVLVDLFGGGGLGTVAGAGLGATDALLLDRFLRGWRPDQFVEKRLQPFAKQE